MTTKQAIEKSAVTMFGRGDQPSNVVDEIMVGSDLLCVSHLSNVWPDACMHVVVR